MIVVAMFDKIWSFLLSGGIFMAFIGLASFVAIAVAIYIALSLRKNVVIPPDTAEEVGRAGFHFNSDSAMTLRAHLDQSNSTLGKIGAIAVSDHFSDRDEASQAVEANAREEIVKLQGGMGILEVIITVAPLLGLLGTVSGLVSVFATMGISEGGDADPSQLAAGIAIALNTTIAGLVVAIFTVIIHSVFTRRLEALAARLEVISGDLLHTFYKHGGPAMYADPVVADEVNG